MARAQGRGRAYGRRAIAAVVASVAVAALVSGCAATGSASSDIAVGEQGMVAGAPAVEGAPDTVAAPAAVPAVDRQVVRNGYVIVRVDDVLASTGSVRALVSRDGGFISAEDTQASDAGSTSTITASVPAARLDAFLEQVSALGTVESVSVSAQDVTSQTVDLDARIAALTTSVDRLTELLAQASRMEDLLAIETQLSQRQSELDSLKQQRSWLADQVAMSSVTVTLMPATAPIATPGFIGGLQSGWTAFVGAVAGALTALGFLLPFLMVLLAAAGIVVAIALASTRRHRRRSTPTGAAAPGQVSETIDA